MEKYNQQFREKNSVISARSKAIYYDKHWGCLSLKFSLNGTETYQTRHSTYSVNESNFLILNLDTEYSSYIESETEVESFTLNFSEKFTSSYFSGMKGQAPRFVERLYKRDGLIFPIVKKIYSRRNEFHVHNDEISELFIELFGALLQHDNHINREIESIQKTRPATRQELYKRLNYAKDFIDSCYSEQINLELLAEVACLSTEYFIRQFKNHFKITPIQYLMSKRMIEAKRLLKTEDVSISEVCERVGYSDLSSFCKLFRRYHNSCATELRGKF